MAKNVSHSEHGKNENIHFRFSVGSKIRCSYIKKGYTSIAGEFTAVGGHLWGKVAEVNLSFHEPMSADNLKKKSHFIKQRSGTGKSKWLQSLFRFYPGNSAQPTIVLSLYKLTENRTEIILTEISHTYIVLLCKMYHCLEPSQHIDCSTSESWETPSVS